MVTVVRAMASNDSGLDVRDRMWLKITIPNAFIGELSVSFKDYTYGTTHLALYS